nr:ArsR family transcriptional regulator [uncultured Blautia sp.]
MMHTKKDIDKLAADFERCQKILLALEDENRQHMILEMMKMGDCNGVRVNAITEKTHLSRPAVSHHLQILKDAGILKMMKQKSDCHFRNNRICLIYIAVIRCPVEKFGHTFCCPCFS